MLFVCVCGCGCRAAGAGRGRKKPPRRVEVVVGALPCGLCGSGERVVVGLWIDNERVQCLVRFGDCSLLFVGQPIVVQEGAEVVGRRCDEVVGHLGDESVDCCVCCWDCFCCLVHMFIVSS